MHLSDRIILYSVYFIKSFVFPFSYKLFLHKKTTFAANTEKHVVDFSIYFSFIAGAV